jgi:outer membrane immunogenic protein
MSTRNVSAGQKTYEQNSQHPLGVALGCITLATSAQAQNWTGYYVGANAGWGWGDTGVENPTEFDAGGAIFSYSNFSVDSDGGVFGLQVGFNRQSGQFVWGVEADFQASDIAGTKRFASSIFANIPSATFDTLIRSELDYFGTVRGRLGYAFQNWLIYATGGLVYGSIDMVLSFPLISGAPSTFADEEGSLQAGYVVGGGLEVRLAPAVSAKLEYMFMDLGSNDHSFLIAGDTYTWGADSDYHILRVGLNLLTSSPAAPAPLK